MAFQLAPPAKTPLGRYRLLSPNAGIHVSPFCLGAMSIGTAWSGVMGTMDKESSFKLLDGFYEKGGNFIDTANNYQAETSEIVIGEWMKARNNRDQIVLATKYSLLYNAENASVQQKVNYAGNSTKSMHISVGASLKKLQTDYIDILYVHFWDYATSVKEVMDSLHNLVQQGKVLYLGISDTPAWVVSQANQYARDFGKTPFVIYEGKWNILERDFERDIIPMARAHGMALAPWSVLAGGKLRSSKEENRRAETGEGGRTMLGTDWRKDESQTKMVEALEKVAAELGNDIDTTAVAIAYVMQKTPYVFPIIGGRKIEQLEANMHALTIQLTSEQIKFLESVQPFSVGFPHDFIGNDLDYGFWMRQAADYAPRPTALPVGHA